MHDDGAAFCRPVLHRPSFLEDRMPTRRDFALTIGAATLGACVGTPPVPPPSAPVPTTTPANAAADANGALADAMMQLVRQRYGAHLTDDQLPRVREDIVGGLRASDRLRATLLPNGTEPDVVFAVHRGGDQ
jgi:hypothetical protein